MGPSFNIFQILNKSFPRIGIWMGLFLLKIGICMGPLQWCNNPGGYFSPGGRVLPRCLSPGTCDDPLGKERQGKIEKKRRKIKRKVVNWKWKEKCMKLYMKMSSGLFETTEICLGFTKMQIPTGKKHFTLGKIRKSDFLKIFLLHHLACSY